MRSSKLAVSIVAVILAAVCVFVGCKIDEDTISTKETEITTKQSLSADDYLFPPPAQITVYYKNLLEHKSLYPGMEIYDYIYKRINERVTKEGTVEMSDADYDNFKVYRNSEICVDFRYNTPSSNLGDIYINFDKNNPDKTEKLYYVLFPFSGKATDSFLLACSIKTVGSDGVESTHPGTKCFGTLKHDQELLDTICEYMGAVTEATTE